MPDKLEPNNNQEAQACLGLPELLLPVTCSNTLSNICAFVFIISFSSTAKLHVLCSMVQNVE